MNINLFIVILSFFSLTLFSSASETNWWNTDWKYRGKIIVLSPRLKSDIDTASFVFYPPHQYVGVGVDIRIIDEEGRATPYKVNLGEGGNLIIDFKVDNPSRAEYYVYSGNPKAERIEYIWGPTTGGLFLETREKIDRLNPANLSQMQELIQPGTKSYGQGQRDRIDDLENPFGPNENYLSIYQGNIFCPLNGSYGFATNSDDASFLLIDGNLVASWPGGHEKEGGTNRPMIDTWGHSGEIYLENGVHLIQYYQEDGKGAQLSRAGWRKPGDKGFNIVPKEAFIDKLRARQVSFQTYGKPLNAFFFTEEKQGIIFNPQIPELISFQFQDACINENSQPLSYQWDFGDGRTSMERNPLQVYPAGRTYKVKLQVKDANGMIDTYEQCIKVGPGSQSKNIRIDWRVTSFLNIFYPQEPLQLGAWVKNYSGADIKLKLAWESFAQKNDRVKQDSREFSLGPEQVGKIDIPLDRFFLEKAMDFYLSYEGNIIGKRQIKFLDAEDEFNRLKVVENHLEDSEGRLVFFRIKQSTGGGKPPYYSPITRDKIDIIALGASLGHKDDDENYRKILSGLLKSYYGDKIKVNLNYMEIPEDRLAGSGLLGIGQIEEVIKQNPALVLYSLGMNEVINHFPLEEFKRSLNFLTAAMRCRGIDSILLIPPPVIDRVKSSMDVAAAIKEVGLRQGVEVADLFSIFALEENTLSKLYQPEAREDVYLLYPQREGQRLIAEQIFETIKKNVPRAKD